MLTLHITGMSCGHCVAAVKKALAAVPGIELDRVEIGTATLQFDATKTDMAHIAHAVEDAGYAVASVS